jgi:hypothetical protein
LGNFCINCSFYEKGIITRAGESFGICHNVAVATKVLVDGQTVLGEDGIIYTEEYFGCVYWRNHGPRILDLKDVMKYRANHIACKNCGK